jgi:hypothetical protein
LVLSPEARAVQEMTKRALALIFHEAWLLSGAPKRKNAPELG